MSSLASESRTSGTAILMTGLWRATLGNLIKRWIATIRSKFQVRRAIHALMALDDRRLADIGLTRGAVEHAVRDGLPPTRDAEPADRSTPQRKSDHDHMPRQPAQH